jgi:hypothetical protein
MFQEIKLTENKINNLVDELNEDRVKYFNDSRSAVGKERILLIKKIDFLDRITKALLAFKGIYIKETIDKDKE